jgi:hypothetical protein
MYMAAGAPLPAGAKPTVQADGVLLVDGPYGPSGIVFKDGDAACYYQILGAPSVIVTGKGSAPTGSTFAKVGCYLPVNQGGSELTLATIAGKPYVIQIGPSGGTSLNETFDPSKGETVLLFQGTMADLQALSADPNSTPDPSAFHGRGGVYTATAATNADGSITVTLTGGTAAGSLITVTCTSDLSSLQPAASPTPAP